VWNYFRFLSGGLRYAATTGYYLTALQDEIRSLRFHTVSVATLSNHGDALREARLSPGQDQGIDIADDFGTQTTQGRATRDIEYDAMGRVVRNGNPYYSASGAASAINPSGLWATRQYDSFSRVTQETLPDQTTAQAAYAGNVITVTDQANKSRRRVTEALGRLARMDEPDASGNLGSVSSPLQPTSYQYDALDNLVHITQVASEHRGDSSSLIWQADYDYDQYGNRMQNDGQNYNLTYMPVQGSEINTSTNRFTSGVTYDAAGQTLSDSKFRGLQYQYNPEGRMIWSANLDGSNPATSVYDGLGQRVQTTQAGVTKKYFYDINGSVVAEYDWRDGLWRVEATECLRCRQITGSR